MSEERLVSQPFQIKILAEVSVVLSNNFICITNL